MPLNDKKIISVILAQVRKMDERCKGYRDEIVDVISDILQYEREHRVQASNIQQKINDKCNGAARFLTENRSQRAGKERNG
jgi:hypothetical protein